MMRTYRGRPAAPFGAILALALALSVPLGAHAQNEARGRIEGVVFDSVHARPLAGAHVVAVGTGSLSAERRESTSDADGRYRIDALPLGRYMVGFESALLDSLEVIQSPREANVGADQLATLDLALPSAAKLRSAVCLGATIPPGTGVIYGHVTSAETASPLAGVQLAMTWRDLGVETKKKRLQVLNQQGSASVVTDQDGWYRMCGVPTGAWVSMQIRHDQRTGPVLRTQVDDTLGIAVRHLSFATGTSDGASSAGTLSLAGTAMLTGTVLGPGRNPVSNAEVRVRGTRGDARTDDRGAFTLGGLPGGTQQLEIRHIGYAVVEEPIDLQPGATTTREIVLRRIVNLDSIFVVATKPKYPDFYIHKSSGFGRFLGPEEIARQRVSRTSDIIEKMPSFIVEQRGWRSIVMAQGTGGFCPSTIVVDGQRVLEYPPNVDDVHPANIGAIELYSPHMSFLAPPEYGNAPCGMVVIWTLR